MNQNCKMDKWKTWDNKVFLHFERTSSLRIQEKYSHDIVFKRVNDEKMRNTSNKCFYKYKKIHTISQGWNPSSFFEESHIWIFYSCHLNRNWQESTCIQFKNKTESFSPTTVLIDLKSLWSEIHIKIKSIQVTVRVDQGKSDVYICAVDFTHRTRVRMAGRKNTE